MGWLSSKKPKATGPTAEERALAKDSAIAYNDHQRMYVPLENSFISSLTASEGERADLRGAQVADIESAMKGQDQAVVGSTLATGAGLGSGKSVMERAGLTDAKGYARGQGVAGADSALRTRETTGMAKMVAFGRGLQDVNRVTSIDAARDATSQAIDATRNAVENQGSFYNMLGTGVGVFAGLGGDFKFGKKKPVEAPKKAGGSNGASALSLSWK